MRQTKDLVETVSELEIFLKNCVVIRSTEAYLPVYDVFPCGIVVAIQSHVTDPSSFVELNTALYIIQTCGALDWNS